jgi:hypothetical protein
MHPTTLLALWVAAGLLAACAGRESGVTPPAATAAAMAGTAAGPLDNQPPTYTSLPAPLIRRSAEPLAGLSDDGGQSFSLFSGEYQLVFNQAAGQAGILLQRPGAPVGLALRPLGLDLALLEHVASVAPLDGPDQIGVRLAGSSGWAEFALDLEVYPHNPGLLRYRLELARTSELPPGSPAPEWTFVDAATGAEAAGGYEAYADRAPFASPSFYGLAAAMDSTLLAWVDITRLTPFVEATRFSPGGMPARQGRSFGHTLGRSELTRLPLDTRLPIYDGYLYLAPGEPGSEQNLFLRYLQQTADIYDLIAHPASPLPDWQDLARRGLADLQDPDTWVELEGKRYWRAYVSDTRQSAEAITQFDLALGAARYIERYGRDDLAGPLLDDLLAVLPDFYNPGFGLIQNSGPLAVTGDQGRGDTWYELGHALKAAELGLLGYEAGAKLALDSQAAWTEFAQTNDYRFPRFYSFATWQGTEREPDAAGGYALYMLRLADLGCGQPCLSEAEAAVRAFAGYGFGFSYETHMTAMSALAAVEVADRIGDDRWLAYAYGPIANLMRLSWVYEVDYGLPAPAHTFFGLAPTQRSAVITPKEHYEAWIYLGEFLRRAHGRIDPSVEKLVAEFYFRSLATMADSLPPRLPAGVSTEHPAAYETVRANRLDLYLPLEDMRDGWSEWGSIGQEVYGAGMGPTLAALAYVEVAPGVTVYSGYPLAAADGLRLTFAGTAGSFAPAIVTGAGSVAGGDGAAVASQPCGQALCFQAEGGSQYVLAP